MLQNFAIGKQNKSLRNSSRRVTFFQGHKMVKDFHRGWGAFPAESQGTKLRNWKKKVLVDLEVAESFLSYSMI